MSAIVRLLSHEKLTTMGNSETKRKLKSICDSISVLTQYSKRSASRRKRSNDDTRSANIWFSTGTGRMADDHVQGPPKSAHFRY